MTGGPRMDDVERMYRHLVRTIRAKYTPMLSQPFEVGELYQTILPYRLHRRDLGLDTNQDYELTLLDLLAGPRGYLVVDDRMRDVLAAQLASPNPDPSVIREFASSHVALAPEWLNLLEAESRTSGAQGVVAGSPPPPLSPPRPTGSFAIGPSGSAGATSDSGPRRAPRPITVAAGDHCSFCKGELPAGRQIQFCPHCGQDLTMVHCPACGSELERGWKYCVTCGRSAADL
jgi:double zinc ribbon protein